MHPTVTLSCFKITVTQDLAVQHDSLLIEHTYLISFDLTVAIIMARLVAIFTYYNTFVTATASLVFIFYAVVSHRTE